MKPRILIFSVAYEPLVGGAELAVRNITDRLPVSRGLEPGESSYEFDLITCRFSRSHEPVEKKGNVRIFRVGFGGRLGRYFYPALAARLAKKLHKENPYQLVWSIMAAYGAAAALMFLRRFPHVKYLLTLQEGDSKAHIHKRVRGFKKFWQEAFRRADYVQAISKYLADWARAEGATCEIEVVPNGVAVEKFAPHPTLSPEGRGIKGEGLKIITTSRLVHKNGIDILLRALADLRATNYQLFILGSGAEDSKLKKLAGDLGVQNKVQFLGHVDPGNIPEYLVKADIFVRASRSEGLGSSFLEAMAAGLPVIGTAVGGITDFLSDGKTGLFSTAEDPKDLAEKIRQLLENSELRKKLGAAGKQLIEQNYSWDHIAGRMDAIFRKLISTSPALRAPSPGLGRDGERSN